MRRRFIIVLVLLCLGMPSCASGPELVPGTLPDSVQLTGKWRSTWGSLMLRQEGKVVSGTSDYRGGTLKGVLKGDLLLYDWRQPSDRSRARAGAKGKGWFRVAQDGQTMEGKWGFEQQLEGGGVWRAERITQHYE